MLVAQNGKIGDTLILRDDERYEVTYVPAGNELYKTVPIICGQFFAPASYYASVYVPAATGRRNPPTARFTTNPASWKRFRTRC